MIFILSSFGQFIPDSSFANKAYIDETNFNNSKLVEQKNGNILNIGTDLFSNTVYIKCFDKLGNPVTSFGLGGIATNPTFAPYLTNNNIEVVTAKVLGNNDIVVLGKITKYTSFWDTTYLSSFILVFDSTGMPKNSFGSSGYVIDKPINSREFDATCLAVDETKSESPIIYLAGASYLKGHTNCNNGYGNWFISSYNYIGTYNLNYNSTGYKSGDASTIKQGATLSSNAFIKDLKIMPNRDIFTIGLLSYDDKSVFSMKMDTSGMWVNNYGINGRSVTTIPSFMVHLITKGSIFNDNSFIFMESFFYNITDTCHSKLIKFNNQGNLDLTFGNNGLDTSLLYTLDFPILRSKKDNSFLLAYYSKNSTSKKAEFKNFKSNGVVDSSFGIYGIHKTEPILFNASDSNSNCISNCLIWNADESELYYSFGTVFVGAISLVNFKTENKLLSNIKTELPCLINLYPNPLYNNTFFIESANNITKLEIFNTTGSLIYSKHLNDRKFEIQLPQNISSNIYFVKLISAGINQVIQINKQ
jgi:Secretion system C-terminal sorting domain